MAMKLWEVEKGKRVKNTCSGQGKGRKRMNDLSFDHGRALEWTFGIDSGVVKLEPERVNEFGGREMQFHDFEGKNRRI